MYYYYFSIARKLSILKLAFIYHYYKLSEGCNILASWLIISTLTGSLEDQLKKLQLEKAEQDKDFGIKRAKFKEIFIQKEGTFITWIIKPNPSDMAEARFGIITSILQIQNW